MENKHNYIIETYLKADPFASVEEEGNFAKLFSNPSGEKALVSQMQDDWELTMGADNSGIRLNHILHRIHRLIDAESSSVKQRRILLLYKFYSKVAAVLLIPLLIMFGIHWLKNIDRSSDITKVHVFSPLGSRIKTELPDGSLVWLNSGSTIEYAIPFRNREVAVSGEAYFKVKSDALHPFTVNGPLVAAKVLGTSFNVKMWPDETIAEIVLAEGAVEMIPHLSKQSFAMQPGEMIIYSNVTNEICRRSVNPEHYSSWISGKLVLRDQNMEEVARSLSRWFNVDVQISDKELNDHCFRATFEDEKLEDVLRLLKLTSPIEYEITDNTRNNQGDFTRKRVVIRKKIK